MKETIKYYYNVYPDSLIEIENGVYFYLNGYKYYFVKYDRNPEEIAFLVQISNDLFKKNILVDTFIKSKDNTFFVSVNEKVYVLLRVNSIENDIYDLKDIIDFNNKLVADKQIHNNWANLWMKRVDSLESEISEYNNEYPLIRETFDYYVGLAENAISYFNDTLIEEDIRTVKITLNHKTILTPTYSGFINNPLTFTFDYEVRDAAEYIKSSFFEGKFYLEDFYEILKKNNSRASLRILYARLLYPNYYFNALEKVFVLDEEESKINKYIEKINNYEVFLNEIYKIINKKVPIPPIEWLNNKK